MRIEAKGISKYYREGEVAAKGLDEVSLVLEEGEFVLVSGPSGCGKSTLAKCLSFNEECDEGELFLFDQDEFLLSEKEKRNFLCHRVTYIGETYFLESCSALDNVMFTLLASGMKKKDAKRMAKASLKEAGLGKVHKKVGKLSGGERDRVMVARALSSPHHFIFLDEPLANLDEVSRAECLDVLSGICSGKTIFLISHAPDEVIPYASRHIKMSEGKIISDERLAKDIKREETLIENRGNASGIIASLRLFFSKPKRTVFSFLVAFALSAFLTFIGYSSTYLISNGFLIDDYDYSFSNHFNNRLVVEGKVIGDIPESSYDDAGDLFSSLSTVLVDENNQRLLNSLQIQPIMADWDLLFGKKGEEGFYLLYDESEALRSSLERRYLESRVGQRYRVTLGYSGTRVIAEAVFRGLFVAPDDFLSLGEYCLCPSASLLEEIRGSLSTILEEEIISPGSHYSSYGPFSSGKQELICGDKRLSSLSPENILAIKSSYLSIYGTELQSGKIYLPESMEGKSFSFFYKGVEITSSMVSDYLLYVPSLLSDGEWALENATAKKIAMELDIERSIYFASRAEMDAFKGQNADSAIIVEAGAGYRVTRYQEVILPVVASIIFLLSFVFIFLSRLLLKRGYKSKEADRKVLLSMGHSSFLLSLGESIAIAIFFLLGLGLGGAIYFAFVPNASRWFAKGAMFFVLSWLLGLLLLPFPKIKEEAK